jgi:hypothetical protein
VTKNSLRTKSGARFEVTHTSPTSLTVCRLSDNAKLALRTKTGLELRNVRVRKDRYVVAKTGRSFVVGDCETGLSSEAPGATDAAGRFESGETTDETVLDFDADHRSCVVKNTQNKTLSIVEYGLDGFLGTCFPITKFRLPDCPYQTDTFIFIVSGVVKPSALNPEVRVEPFPN